MDVVTELENLKIILSGLCQDVQNEMLESGVSRIPNDVDYSVVFNDYILKNIPFILPIVHNDWKCFNEWVVNEKPNFVYLKQKFGNTDVPVANCQKKYYNAQEKDNMLLTDFLDYWKDYIDNNYPSEMKCLYLKDWHFVRDFPEENIYKVPKYFSSDWLNEYLVSKDGDDVIKDDYRFVYMGPKGTWTPFHSDVFSSFSWSANICGTKRWLLFPPGEEKYLKDNFGNLVYDVEGISENDKILCLGDKSGIKYYELIQGPGEAVFVPSGWHHQVWNLDDTISINHNWINGCNIKMMWESLQQNLSCVKKEINDCRSMDGWENHCQIMLKASFGIDYLEFYNFLKFILNKRINMINNNEQIMVFGGWKLGTAHAFFDVMKIKDILCDIILNSDVQLLDSLQENFVEMKLLIEKIDAMEMIAS